MCTVVSDMERFAGDLFMSLFFVLDSGVASIFAAKRTHKEA